MSFESAGYQLLPVLRTAHARATGPTLIHVLTKKGKGYAPAEAARDKGHATGKFDVLTGVQVKAASNAPSYTKTFAQALIAEAEADDKIVAITAAMPDGTGLDLFGARFPKRTFDVGIAEQHAVTFAAGLAAQGMRPFAAIYSTFLQRGYDSVQHDVDLQKLPVRFPMDRAGLVGADGANGVVAKAAGLDAGIVRGVALEGNVPWELLDRDRYASTAVIEFGAPAGGDPIRRSFSRRSGQACTRPPARQRRCRW